MIPTHQTGAVTELRAATHMVELGYDVFFPITINPKADFVAVKGNETLRVQVKKATWSKAGPYEYLQVRLLGKKCGDSQRVYKLEDFDLLIIIEGDDMWKVPVKEVIGKTSLCLKSTNPNPRKHSKDYNPDTWRNPTGV